jgi:iron(III) transport system substrate-binding protein
MEFEKQTGIRVKAVFDTEETKSTGVMNRLLAEKQNPQADVYWANEPVRARVLRDQGIAAVLHPENAKGIPAEFKDQDGYWTGFSARARVFVVHKNARVRPTGIRSYLEPSAKGRAVIANPMFGTTTAQMAALFTIWGEANTRQFLEGLRANQISISSSNGESADLVASGEFDFALVDSDDAVSRMRQGKPIELVYPDQGEGGLGVFVIPNAVVLIKGGPNPVEGKRLVEYLVSKESERQLAFADCAQIPLNQGVPLPKELQPIEKLRAMRVDYAQMARTLQDIQPLLKQWSGH